MYSGLQIDALFLPTRILPWLALAFAGLFLSWYLAPTRDDRRTILMLYGLAVLFRLTSIALLHAHSVAHGNQGFFFLDDRSYHAQALNLLNALQGGYLYSSLLSLGTYHFGYPLLLAVWYWLTSPDSLDGKLMNAPIGALAAVLSYSLGRQVFGRSVGRLAGLFVALFPNLLFWSGTLLKDTILTTVVVAVITVAQRVAQARNLRGLAMYALLLLLMAPLRTFMVVILFFTTISFWSLRGVLGRVSLRRWLMGLGFGASFLVSAGLARPLVWWVRNFWDAYVYSLENLPTAYPGTFLHKALRGLILTVLAPFAWKVPADYAPMVLMYVGMWIWYLLLPFIAIGVIATARQQRTALFNLLCPAVSVSLVYILAYGDGSARQMVTVYPLWLMFASAGANAVWQGSPGSRLMWFARRPASDQRGFSKERP